MAAVIIPDKICPHCGENRWVLHREKRPTVSNPDAIYERYRCAKQTKERRDRWNNNNQEYVKEYTKKRDIKRRAEGYWTTPKMQAYFRGKEQEYRDKLTDKYIRVLWRKNHDHRDHELTPEEMEIYRKYLITQRQLKQLNNGKESKN